MHKVNVSVPAVSTNIGPGYDVLGLALNLRNTIEMSLRADGQLTVEVRGEGKGALPENYHHPVMQGAIKLFQRLEQAPAGLSVRCTNVIPLDVGLSSRTTMIVGGLVGANNLLGSPFSPAVIIELATELSGQPEAVVTAMRGGLGMCSTGRSGLLYRTIEIAPLQVVIILPHLPEYTPRLRDDLPSQVTLGDAVYNMGHTALVIEALREGDFKLLREALLDRLHEPHRLDTIPAYSAVATAAKEAGALAITLCGAGPALLVFAATNHHSIEDAVKNVFESISIPTQTWSVGVDMQGVVISVVQ